MRSPSRLDRIAGALLRAGVGTSSVCLAIGLVMELAGFGPVAHACLNGGLILLLATPAAFVAVSAVEYLLARDWVFVALATIVLVELLLSVLAALVLKRTFVV